jgi:hypothetical protein
MWRRRSYHIYKLWWKDDNGKCNQNNQTHLPDRGKKLKYQKLCQWQRITSWKTWTARVFHDTIGKKSIRLTNKLNGGGKIKPKKKTKMKESNEYKIVKVDQDLWLEPKPNKIILNKLKFEKNINIMIKDDNRIKKHSGKMNHTLWHF